MQKCISNNPKNASKSGVDIISANGKTLNLYK